MVVCENAVLTSLLMGTLVSIVAISLFILVALPMILHTFKTMKKNQKLNE